MKELVFIHENLERGKCPSKIFSYMVTIHQHSNSGKSINNIIVDKHQKLSLIAPEFKVKKKQKTSLEPDLNKRPMDY